MPMHVRVAPQDVATAFDLAHHAFVIEQGNVAIQAKRAPSPRIQRSARRIWGSNCCRFLEASTQNGDAAVRDGDGLGAVVGCKDDDVLLVR